MCVRLTVYHRALATVDGSLNGVFPPFLWFLWNDLLTCSQTPGAIAAGCRRNDSMRKFALGALWSDEWTTPDIYGPSWVTHPSELGHTRGVVTRYYPGEKWEVAPIGTVVWC